MKQKHRTFLLLQGVASPFFGRLAHALECSGHQVVRVNFNAGDSFYWFGRRAESFRGPLAELPNFLEQVWERYQITDQVLFGDRRPVHRPAVEQAERYGIRTHVFEEGYFRPYWVTLEREGVNGHSLLPRDPDWFRRAAEVVPACTGTQSFRSPFRKRAFYDVVYHLPGMLNPVLYPHYETHAPITAPVEYAGYISRFARLPFWKKRDARLIENLCVDEGRFYVLPLQLNTDAQIKDHSRFDSMLGVLEYVLASFSLHAEPGSKLLVKNHPLDMGLVNYPSYLKKLVRRFKLDGRVLFVETGDLNLLLKHAAGVVTVNSTVGLLSVEHGCPTLCLSDPIYNLPGLTSTCGIDAFWSEGLSPESAFADAFKRVVTFATQVNGGFYCSAGMQLAVDNSVKVLTADESPLEWLLRVCPP